MIEIVEIPTENLQIYDKNINVVTGSNLLLLMNSIKKEGILSPLIVTPNGNGTYTVIDGNHRLPIAEDLGIDKVPCIIRTEMSEEEKLRECVHINCFKGQIGVDRLSAIITRMINEGKTIEEISELFKIRKDWVLQYHSWYNVDTSYIEGDEKKYRDSEKPVTIPLTIPRKIASKILKYCKKFGYKEIGSYMSILFMHVLKNYKRTPEEAIEIIYDEIACDLNQKVNLSILKHEIEDDVITDREKISKLRSGIHYLKRIQITLNERIKSNKSLFAINNSISEEITRIERMIRQTKTGRMRGVS